MALLVPPSIVCAVLTGITEDSLTDKAKGILQFSLEITINLVFVNSSTDAVLFLASNVKSKKYMRSFLKCSEGSSVKPKSTESI